MTFSSYISICQPKQSWANRKRVFKKSYSLDVRSAQQDKKSLHESLDFDSSVTSKLSNLGVSQRWPSGHIWLANGFTYKLNKYSANWVTLPLAVSLVGLVLLSPPISNPHFTYFLDMDVLLYLYKVSCRQASWNMISNDHHAVLWQHMKRQPK